MRVRREGGGELIDSVQAGASWLVLASCVQAVVTETERTNEME